MFTTIVNTRRLWAKKKKLKQQGKRTQRISLFVIQLFVMSLDCQVVNCRHKNNKFQRWSRKFFLLVGPFVKKRSARVISGPPCDRPQSGKVQKAHATCPSFTCGRDFLAADVTNERAAYSAEYPSFSNIRYPLRPLKGG